MGRRRSSTALPGLRAWHASNGTGEVRPTDGDLEGRTDFWWDEYAGNTGNCWHDNIGQDGTAGSITSLPPSPLLPSACSNLSIGTIGPAQEPELLNCLADIEFDTATCPWFTTPSKP